MAKVLVWNLENFGINKINDPRMTRARKAGGNTFSLASFYRRILVNRNFLYANPDIIILIEVSSGDNRLSDLATQSGGMQGCLYILNYLRNNYVYASATWRLVPPLRVGLGGKTETVAVFYRGQSTVGGNTVNRYFTGPNVWSGGYAGFSVEPGTAAAAAYPTPPAVGGNLDINSMLVPPATAARNIPGAALHNGGVAENRVAARNRFRDFDNGNPGDFLDFSTLREPYMVTFTETDGGGNVQRNLTLFAVHAPAVVGDQGAFMNALATMYDVVSNLGANETRIVCGDFNLNLLNPNGTLSNAYLPLTNNAYTLLLRPAGAPPVNLDRYQGYFATHIKPPKNTAGSLFLWSQANNPTLSYYPGYGYIGSDQLANFYSIDNILVRPFNGGHNYRTTIMNYVTGAPLNAVANPAGNPPLGSILLAQSFGTLPWPPSPTAPNWSIGRARSLTGWINYGHIYRTSDHFAVYAEI